MTVAIRPEAWAIDWRGPDRPDAGAEINRVPTTLERLLDLGPFVQLNTRAPGGWPIHALVPQTQILGARAGQALGLSVHPDHVAILAGRT